METEWRRGGLVDSAVRFGLGGSGLIAKLDSLPPQIRVTLLKNGDPPIEY